MLGYSFQKSCNDNEDRKPCRGGHALKQLEAGLAPKPTAAAEQPNHERSEESNLERHSVQVRSLAEI